MSYCNSHNGDIQANVPLILTPHNVLGSVSKRYIPVCMYYVGPRLYPTYTYKRVHKIVPVALFTDFLQTFLLAPVIYRSNQVHQSVEF